MKIDNFGSFLLGFTFMGSLAMIMFYCTYLVHIREMSNEIRIIKMHIDDIHKSSSLAENYIIDKHKK